MFPDGVSGSCRAERGIWGGGAGSHPGPADLWGLLDGKKSGGITRPNLKYHTKARQKMFAPPVTCSCILSIASHIVCYNHLQRVMFIVLGKRHYVKDFRL